MQLTSAIARLIAIVLTALATSCAETTTHPGDVADAGGDVPIVPDAAPPPPPQPPPPQPDMSRPMPPPPRDCHTDCSPGYSCRDGVVIEHVGGPVRSGCSEPAPCPRRELFHCLEGCRDDDVFAFPPLTPVLLCAEQPLPGDHCNTSEDCASIPLPPDYSGPRPFRNLACDLDAGICSLTFPTDLGGACGVDPTPDGAVAGYGVRQDPTCISGLCSFSGEACSRCTVECGSDEDCPAGELCREQRDWSSTDAEARTLACVGPDGC